MPSEFLQRQKNDFFRDMTSFGSLWFYAIFMVFFLILGDYSSFKVLLSGFILMYFAVIIIRSIYFKNRPIKYNYNNYIEKLDASSFPSLHASRTAFLAGFFIEYFSNLLASAFLAALALIVVYSRIYLNRHDWKDVSAGAVLGALAYFAVNYIL
ncbi:phosphatase PAP2 family protein [Candidatus Woesearchaeota archaeon]|nr:phosphatase PAP2 family protein [Candidatus Woesearchaeota archaeon]